MKLYELAESYKGVAELLENPEFASNEDVLSALDNIEDEFNNKGVQLVFVIKNMESDNNALEQEIKRLQALKTSRKKHIEGVRNYLKYNMEYTGIDKISCPLFSITLSKPSLNAVLIEDESKIPAQYRVVKTEINKSAIKTAIKNGELINGARLIEVRTLRIA